ncbi:MAG: hypothetical protein P9L97_06125 [Candidatus Tenebribacter davisii]|nr:hypothetical protein [Candidatus Tenebribacter davisii]
MPIEHSLKMLEEVFEEQVILFGTDDWKFYKFGLGGPYKRNLTKLQRLSDDHDEVIQTHFGLSEETASFNKLIVLCLSAAKDPKERFKNIDTFRRQIARMKRIL